MNRETKKRCWAASLGGCAGKISREHIVSSAFFDSSNIAASGFDWTGENNFQISLKNAVAKILCQEHNTQLSYLDTEAKEISSTFQNYIKAVSDSNSKQKSQYVGRVNGTNFERWLLKTTLNIICSSPKKYNNFWPDNYLAGLAFGKIKFDYGTGMGLYFVHPETYKHAVNAYNFVNVRPAILSFENDIGLLGAIVTFWGIPFFLKTAAKTENMRLEMNGHDLIDKRFYHLKSLNSFEDGSLVNFPRIDFEYETYSTESLD